MSRTALLRSVLAASVLLGGSMLHGQTGAGAIEGTVKDTSGAVIPGAQIRVVHIATSVARESKANEVGFFTFPQATIGQYKVSVAAQGLKRWEAEVKVITGQTSTVSVELQVGTAAESITVSGDVTALVVENSPTIGQVLERSRIEQLPLNGRSFTTLLAGVTPGAEGTRVNGMWDAALEILQDGAVLRNLDTATIAARPPGLDTMGEFRVETSSSSARFDRPATAIMTTRGGTNDLHGSAFETARNSGIGVARRRQDMFTKPPHLVRNEFGVSVGAPVLLPKIYNGKGKTFFFFAYEALRQRQGTTAPTTVFPEAWRQGDFGGLTNAAGQKLTIYDPNTTGAQSANWSRTPFPNNAIPVSRMSPVAKYIYSVTPLPTLPNVNPLVTSNWFGTAPNNQNDYTASTRIDHTFSDRDRIFGRYSQGSSNRAYPPNASSGPPTLDYSTNQTIGQYFDRSGVVSWTHTFSPTFFSETFLGASWENMNIYTGDFFKDWSGKLGLPNIFQGEGFPSLYNTGVNMTFIQGDTRRQNKSLLMTLDQNFTKVRGKHELQFGGRIRADRANVLPDQQYGSGNFSFASAATGLYDPTSGSNYSATPQTNFDGANFFLGVAGSYADQMNPKLYKFRSYEYAMYFQDNWRVNSRLTINLGLRWGFNPPLHEQAGVMQSFNLKTMAIVNQSSLEELYKINRTSPAVVNTFTRLGVKFETPADAGLNPNILNSYYRNFGPRVGFAWRALGSRRPLIVRGGFGLYDYATPLRNFDASTRTNPPFSASFNTNYTSAAASPDGLPNYALRSVPKVIAGVNSANVVDPASPVGITPGGFQTVFFDPDFPDTRMANWNLTVEREVIANTVVRASYQGTHGWNLEQIHTMNEAPNSYIWYVTTGLPTPTGTYASTAMRNLSTTTYGNLMEYGKYGWSNSNGVQMSVERRYAKGFAYQFFYVLNNAMRTGGNGWRDNLVHDPNYYLPGAVPESFEARNRLLYYQRDTAVPKHRVRWNWLVDLPFGKGKWIGANSGGFMNRLIGGWQLSGFGTWRSNYWALPTGNFGQFGNVEIYGTKYKIEDCRGGQCIPGYLYWNGYIQANQINTTNAAGKCTGICGVPSNYKPSNQPVIPFPATTITGDPNAPYYGTNTVWVQMKNGTLQRTAVATNLHPWQNQYVAGPGNFGLDASIVKNVPITERISLRVNADFFSVLNNPGMGQPGSNGIISLQNSSNSARVMQLSGRITW